MSQAQHEDRLGKRVHLRNICVQLPEVQDVFLDEKATSVWKRDRAGFLLPRNWSRSSAGCAVNPHGYHTHSAPSPLGSSFYMQPPDATSFPITSFLNFHSLHCLLAR
jgi:hypothetical protein